MDSQLWMLGGAHIWTSNGDEFLGAEFSTRFWSMKKLKWVNIQNPPKLPTNFSLISGCALTLTRNDILLIGGHHTYKPYWEDREHAMRVVPNDQVLLFNSTLQTWSWMENIPLKHKIYPYIYNLECSIVQNKSFEM